MRFERFITFRNIECVCFFMYSWYLICAGFKPVPLPRCMRAAFSPLVKVRGRMCEPENADRSRYVLQSGEHLRARSGRAFKVTEPFDLVTVTGSPFGPGTGSESNLQRELHPHLANASRTKNWKRKKTHLLWRVPDGRKRSGPEGERPLCCLSSCPMSEKKRERRIDWEPHANEGSSLFV